MNQSEFEGKYRALYKSTGLLFGRYKFNVIENETAVSYHISNDGYWEGYVSARIYDFFSERNVKLSFDIGANIGYYSFLYHYLGSKVVAFEPTQVGYDVLYKNVVDNGLEDDIICVKKAISDREGKARIHSEAGAPNSYITMETDGGDVDTLTVDMATILYGIPDFIKIDIEGAEYAAVLGMNSTLESGKLVGLQVEMADLRGYNKIDLHGFLSKYFKYSVDMLSGMDGKDAAAQRPFCDFLFYN